MRRLLPTFSLLPLFALLAGCAAADPQSSWHLDSAELEVTLDAGPGIDGHRFTVVDKRTHRRWIAESPITPSSVTKTADDTLRIGMHDPASQHDYTVQTILGEPARMRFRIDSPDHDSTFAGLVYPPAFRTDWQDGHLLLFDRSAGMMVPQDDPAQRGALRTVYANTEALDMPWTGVAGGEAGDGLMAIYETPLEISVRWDPDETGRVWPQSIWFDTRGTFGYARAMSYQWIADGGYVAQAKAYREIAKASGQLIPLRDRVAERLHVEWLRRAAILWGAQGVDLGRQMHTYGVRRAVVNGHGRISADDIRALTDLGFLTGEYDGYTDFMEGPTGPHSDPVEEAALYGKDGKPTMGWKTAAGVQYYFRSPAMFERAAKAILPPLFEKYPYTARFFDVVPGLTLMEDYHPNHSFGRAGDKEYRTQLLQYARSFGIVIGGEHPKAWAAPLLDYGEGNMSGPYWWKSPKPGQLQPYADKAEIPPDFLKYGLDNAVRVPLWELVFHEGLVSTWYWGDSNGWMYGIWPELSETKDAANILYGTPPLMWADHLCYGWNRNRVRFLQTYHNICHFTEAVQFEEMTSHEFLGAGHLLQRTRFGNGAVAVVNFSDLPVAYQTEEGESILLAARGFYAAGPGIDQRRVQTPDGIVTEIRAKDFFSVDSPSARTVGPLTASGLVWVTRMEASRWNVVARTRHAFTIDVAQLSDGIDPAHVRVVSIDEGGRFTAEVAPDRQGSALTFAPDGEERLYAVLLGAAPGDVLMVPDGGEVTPTTPIALKVGRTDAEVRYTLDGSEPTVASPLYAEPVLLEAAATVRARAFIGGAPAGAPAVGLYGVSKELVSTGPVRGGDPARRLTVPMAGVRQLRIAINDAADGLDYDTCLMGDPTLVRRDGTRVSLMDVEPQLAVQSSGAPDFDNPQRSVQGHRFQRAILTHAHASFVYDLDGQYDSLEVSVGVEDRTENRGSVAFLFTGRF